MSTCIPPGATGQGVPGHSTAQRLDFPPFPLHKSCCPHNGHLASPFSWWLAPLGAEQGHFQHAAPMMPPSLTALLFLQGGFDRAGPGGEGCWEPWVGWGRGTQGQAPCRLPVPWLCPAPSGTAVPWQPLYKPFPRDAFGIWRQLHFHEPVLCVPGNPTKSSAAAEERP